MLWNAEIVCPETIDTRSFFAQGVKVEIKGWGDGTVLEVVGSAICI